MSRPGVKALANDARLLAICREISGRELIPYKATLFNKTGKANWLVAWHQDTALPVEQYVESDGWGQATLKDGVLFAHEPFSILKNIIALRIHLDDSTRENGPLRVIPYSHQHEIDRDIDLTRIIEEGPQLELTVARGGVIVMSPLLVHASSKCSEAKPRRVIHIEYSNSMDPAPGVRLAIS